MFAAMLLREQDWLITGFTITGGHAKYGAGICCWDNCSPTISQCVITVHKPLWQDEHTYEGAGRWWMQQVHPILAQAKVDAVFAGHIHKYACHPVLDNVHS